MRYNVNAKNAAVTMKGKTYNRTIMTGGNAQIIVPLDKKYVRFEAEIGLENRSSNGSVIFRVQGITGSEAAGKNCERLSCGSCPVLAVCRGEI